MKKETYINSEDAELELLPNGELQIIDSKQSHKVISYQLDYYDINSLIDDLEKLKDTMRPANTE
tara:strand:- start:766 stop:957 length:192 start_codon:yes stop_codon:yes gene_type:complete